MLSRITVAAASVFVTFAVGSAGVSAAAEPSTPSTAGSQVCRACHEELFARYERNVHAGAEAQRRRPGREGCESCHGAGSAHAADPSVITGLVTFAAGSESASIVACLRCHATDSRVGPYDRAQHGRHQVACTECHLSPHAEVAAELRRSRVTGEETAPEIGFHLRQDSVELCLSCHPELKGRQSLPYHHPVQERAILCVDCHNPHASLPADERGRRALCFSCHEDKRGPWPFEHAPVAEDCASCHEPHGSVAPQLLTTAQPFLCLSCHSLPDDRHGEEIGGTQFSAAIYGRCTSCHGAIHGSHEDRHLKR